MVSLIHQSHPRYLQALVQVLRTQRLNLIQQIKYILSLEKPLKEIKMPSGVMLGAIVREGEMFCPGILQYFSDFTI